MIKNGADKKRLPISIGMLIVLGCYISMGALHIDPISSSLPIMSVEFGASSKEMIRVSSAYFLGNILGYFFAGPLADCIGRKKTAIAGLVCTITGAFFCYCSKGILSLTIGRSIMGLGASAALCTGRAIGGDIGKESSAARILSNMQIVSGFIAIIMPITGNFVAQLFGWRRVFFMMMIIDACIITGTITLVKETNANNNASSIKMLLKSIKYAGSNPALIFAIFAFSFGISTFYSYVSSVSIVMQNEFEMSPDSFSVLYAFLGATMVPGAFLSSYLTKKIRTDKCFIITVMIQFIVAFLAVLMYMTNTISLTRIATCFGIITFTSSIVIPVGMGLALSESEEIKGSIAAVCGIFQSCISWVVSTFLSKINISSSLGMTCCVLFCITTICAMSSCLIISRVRINNV